MQEYIDCEKIEYLILSIMGTFDEKYQFITTKLSETLERVDIVQKKRNPKNPLLTFQKKSISYVWFLAI